MPTRSATVAAQAKAKVATKALAAPPGGETDESPGPVKAKSWKYVVYLVLRHKPPLNGYVMFRGVYAVGLSLRASADYEAILTAAVEELRAGRLDSKEGVKAWVAARVAQ